MCPGRVRAMFVGAYRTPRARKPSFWRHDPHSPLYKSLTLCLRSVTQSILTAPVRHDLWWRSLCVRTAYPFCWLVYSSLEFPLWRLLVVQQTCGTKASPHTRRCSPPSGTRACAPFASLVLVLPRLSHSGLRSVAQVGHGLVYCREP